MAAADAARQQEGCRDRDRKRDRRNNAVTFTRHTVVSPPVIKALPTSILVVRRQGFEPRTR